MMAYVTGGAPPIQTVAGAFNTIARAEMPPIWTFIHHVLTTDLLDFIDSTNRGRHCLSFNWEYIDLVRVRG